MRSLRTVLALLFGIGVAIGVSYAGAESAPSGSPDTLPPPPPYAPPLLLPHPDDPTRIDPASVPLENWVVIDGREQKISREEYIALLESDAGSGPREDLKVVNSAEGPEAALP